MNWFKKLWQGESKPLEQKNKALPKRQMLTATDYTFTPRAQQVLALAHKEAGRLNSNIVDTEHLLLGFIKLGQGIGMNCLERLGLDLEAIRKEVEAQIGTVTEQHIYGALPYSPRVKKVLALAQNESQRLHHTYTGTEHILLGILREDGSKAAKILKKFGVDLEKARAAVLRELDPNVYAPLNLDDKTLPAPVTFVPPTSKAVLLKPESIDLEKRYDVDCGEPRQELVVYRNVRFKAIRHLFNAGDHDLASEFIELELADGKTIFVSRMSIRKFCEHTSTPG